MHSASQSPGERSQSGTNVYSVLLYLFLGTLAHRGRNESTLAEMAGNLEVVLKEFPALRSNMF